MLGNRGHLLTEQRNENSDAIDRLSVEQAFDVVNAEDQTIAAAVCRAKVEICAAVRLAVRAFVQGGRLLYVGAGTSGRLGVIDAAECPPTFMTNPEMVQGIIAGGYEAMVRSIEGAEDSASEAISAIAERNVTDRDVVMGIATGATTPYVHHALTEAKERGAATIFFACVPRSEQDDDADVSIRALTGPEVVTGSTRMKAGTATKMVLNMITTLSMIQMGKVYGNLMVDLNRRACMKLRDRAVRIVQQATGIDRDDAARVLDKAEDVKTAIVMHMKKCNRDQARKLLAEAHGRLQSIVND